PPQDFAPFAGRHLAPCACWIVKRLARRGHGVIHVLRTGFGDLRQHVARCRVHSVKSFAGTLGPLAVDEQFTRGNFCFGCGKHMCIPCCFFLKSRVRGRFCRDEGSVPPPNCWPLSPSWRYGSLAPLGTSEKAISP